MTKRRGYTVLDPNAKTAPSREPREFKPLTISPAMRVALDRARAAQPPVKTMATNVVLPYIDWSGKT